jgi:hypothetical protein
MFVKRLPNHRRFRVVFRGIPFSQTTSRPSNRRQGTAANPLTI